MKSLKILLAVMAITLLTFSSSVFAQKKSILNLSSNRWQWVSIHEGSGGVVIPDNVDQYSIFFNKNGNIYCSTDCNSFSSEYHVDGNSLKFSGFSGTKMFCVDSQEFVFINFLKHVESYRIEDNFLILTMDKGAGTMIFKVKEG